MFQHWPDVPVKVLIGAGDRCFPAEFQRRRAKDRLGVGADEIPAGTSSRWATWPASPTASTATQPN